MKKKLPRSVRATAAAFAVFMTAVTLSGVLAMGTPQHDSSTALSAASQATHTVVVAASPSIGPSAR